MIEYLYNNVGKNLFVFERMGTILTKADRKLLNLLAKSYPTISDVSSEIINLRAILNLPKGTEHFLSDLHGEYEAFLHLRNSASGVIREKTELLFGGVLKEEEITTLVTLIYYPKEKLDELEKSGVTTPEWYNETLRRMVEICRLLASKYTRSKTRKLLPKSYVYILEELLGGIQGSFDRKEYYNSIISTIAGSSRNRDFIIALSDTIKRLAVDRLHILGDIFDRGSRPDVIMESISTGTNVDIQWGNHDILWMGAAGGSTACIATVLNNSITYKNLDVIEIGYGISLRPLALFANATYSDCDISAFMPKESGEAGTEKDNYLMARMHKAIAIIQFKAEAEVIRRNPQFNMDERILLDKINYSKATVNIGGTDYPLCDADFPTVNEKDPLAFTEGELEVINYLKTAFRKSEKLQRHVDFLFERGDLYKIHNSNLLLHGCVPINEDGSLMEFEFDGRKMHGREFMDYLETIVRKGFYSPQNSPAHEKGLDYMWFLWCGKNSPLCGRLKITTFERLLVEDSSTYDEPKNAYYRNVDNDRVIDTIFKEFSLCGSLGGGLHSHIINGHVPVISKAGESPVKGSGRLIIIDGGFCKAYHKKTGIAGYTLVYSANRMRISAHEPFEGKEKAIREGSDIHSKSNVFERPTEPIRVIETDDGKEILKNIEDLAALLEAYETGEIKENLHKQKY